MHHRQRSSIVTLFFAGLATTASALPAQPVDEDFPPPAHQVLLLGTFHFVDAGLDEYKPEVDVDITSDQRQKELAGVLDALARFAPTRIAVEVRPERQEALDERYRRFVDGELELSSNEVHQLGFRLAKRLGHQRVYAFDAESRWYEPWIDPDEYARSHGQVELVLSRWYLRYQRLWQEDDRAKAQRTLTETFLAINDPEAIRRSHGVYLIGTFGAGIGDEYPGADSKTAWYNRNLRMFANLQRITEADNERILAIVGAGHLPILRHCVETSPEYELVEVSSVLRSESGSAPAAVDAAELVRRHTTEIGRDGELGGEGLERLLREAERSQFVLLAEPHNTDQVNQITGELFELLHERAGFRHLVTEQDAAIMERLIAPGVRGDLDAVRAVARRSPRALHFDTDAELALIATVGRVSDAPDPIWGVDRVLDAEVGLEAVLGVTESERDRERILEVIGEARSFSPAAGKGVPQRYLTSDSPRLEALLADLRPAPESRAAELLDALRISREDLRAYEMEHPPGEPWGYPANLRRELLMKDRFTRHYRRAVAAGEPKPRAIAKLGHWHIVRGHNRGNVSSLGSFLVDLARFHGMAALSIAIQPVNRPGRHWSITDYPEYAPLTDVADPERWLLVDLRPLRAHVHTGTLDVSAEAHAEIFGYDLLLFLGGTDRGRITWNRPSSRFPAGPAGIR